ncbi:acetylornithine deacetylase/succinyl-diaminopimelate desuccinylase-like protein [Rhodoligotrophos appendicifer]|uniref:M20 family metallopeptidase n=1 Tax=Rhodoligotrophos appendicifer TaxID=987056 RepID=UPI0011867945|nr:M20 family metallopeptidase [Rhodoligotrophos appendicifer]
MTLPHTIPSNVEASFIETLLQPLIRLNTENPPGNEQPAAALVTAYLDRAGFNVEEIVAAPGRSNVIGVAQGSRAGKTIVLNGHLDTQPLGRDTGWTRDPCSGDISGGRIHGRGTGDMKSGVAAMIAGAEAFLKGGDDFAGRVVLLASADETSGGYLGVGAVLDKLAALKPDMAVICEPTLGDVGIGHRGAGWIEITVTGKAGQAGKVHTGINAILVAADMIAILERDLPATFPVGRSRWLPEPSLNIGSINGGIKPNIIPQVCRFVLDRRVTLGETVEDIVAPVHQIASAVAERWAAQVTAEVIMFVPASEVSEDEPIIAACARAFAEVTGKSGKLRGIGGFTDAHFFIDKLHVPAINFGPWYITPNPRGSYSDIPDEYGLIDEIVTGARVYEHLLNLILRGD